MYFYLVQGAGSMPWHGKFHKAPFWKSSLLPLAIPELLTMAKMYN